MTAATACIPAQLQLQALDSAGAQQWPCVADNEIPPLPPGQLATEPLRLAWNTAHADSAAPGPHAGTPAAVLIALLPDGKNTAAPLCLLTQRAQHLRHHAGQISFPGGSLEPGESAQAAALREAEEETGLNSGSVEVLGALPGYSTITGFAITPFVALAAMPPHWQPAPGEVESVLLLPLADLLNPAYRRRHRAERGGKVYEFFSVTLGEYFIWGATAALLRSLHAWLLRAAALAA